MKPDNDSYDATQEEELSRLLECEPEIPLTRDGFEALIERNEYGDVEMNHGFRKLPCPPAE